MRLSKQFLGVNFPPKNYTNERTSQLLTDGLVSHFSSAGIPYYMPIGKAILDNLEKVLVQQAEKSGCDMVEIPSIMSNDLVENGQEIGGEFRNKFMVLTDRMSGNHLLSTPEMLFVKLAQTTLLSHRQFPIRQVYMMDFFRQIHDARSILKGKQFRVFGGISLERDENGVKDGLSVFRAMTESAFVTMGLPYHMERNRGYLDAEYFYLADEEGDNIVLDGVDKHARVKALSLAMVYHYAAGKNLSMRYRTSTNKNGKPRLVTYGLGVQRLLYCVMDHYRDEKGFNLPCNLRPFDISVIPRSEDERDMSERAYHLLKQSGRKVCLDDRYRLRVSDREQAADYIGCNYKVVIAPEGINVKTRDGEIITQFQNVDTFSTFVEGHAPQQKLPMFSPSRNS